MKVIVMYVRKKPNSKRKNETKLMSLAAMPIVIGSLGIADALHPFKLIIAEASDPVCFVGGAIGLYRIGMGDREGGFKQVLNATFAQVGFFIWPQIQAAVRSGLS